MEQTISVEREGPIARIWLARPEVHNAFNEILIADLDGAIARLAADPAVRVIVLGGRGRSFCAGADLAWMRRAAAAGSAENLLDARRFAAMLDRLARVAKPTIARVHGAAMGGGVGLAAACDICVVTPEAHFTMSEVRLGLLPAVIGPYVARAMGARQALRYVQTAERIDAARALALGLAHDLVPPEALDARIGSLCEDLLGGAPGAQAAAKSLVLEVAGRPIDAQVLEATAAAIAAQRATVEAREGMEAFLARRAPHWRA